MSRKISFSQEEFYHIYNRGTEKRVIFTNNSDYGRFIALLYLCNGSNIVDISFQGSTLNEVIGFKRGDQLVDICCYCLMPNHFHLLLHEINEGGISRFMHKLTTAYTMYFNNKYKRTGGLFEGRFKAIHVDNDRYLKYLISYIHLNPIKIIDPLWKERKITNEKKVASFLENYSYSSFLDFIGNNRLENIIINKSALPNYFDTPQNLKKMTLEWLNYVEG